jgi:hypothetical protein
MEQEYHNEHTSQGAEVMFGKRYVYGRGHIALVLADYHRISVLA